MLRREVNVAVDFFAAMPNIAHPLQLPQDVGLDYLTLGQPSSTLIGGAAQCIKLVSELVKVRDEFLTSPVAFGDPPPEGALALLGSVPVLRLAERRGPRAAYDLAPG